MNTRIRNISFAIVLLALLFMLVLRASSHVITTPAIPSPPRASLVELPFELKGGLVFIKVKVNGKPANFILDSGSPMLVLNSRLGAVATDTLAGKGIGGTFRMQQVLVSDLELGDLKQQQIPAVAVELSHIEQMTKRPIDGLIGYSTLSDYEMLLDYKTKTLTLFLPNASDYHQSIKPTSEMTFELQAHLPVVRAQIGNQTLQLGLDTGAEANLLDLASQSRLQASDYQNGKNTPVSGASQGMITAQAASVKSTKVNGHSYPDMAYIFSDISHMKNGYGLHIDGLLGYPFLSARKISVNYPKRKIYFWD